MLQAAVLEILNQLFTSDTSQLRVHELCEDTYDKCYTLFLDKRVISSCISNNLPHKEAIDIEIIKRTKLS